MQMSVFLAQQMRQYSLLFRIFTDFTLSTQKTEKSTVHFHTEFQVYKDALPKLEIMIYSALILVPMAEALGNFGRSKAELFARRATGPPSSSTATRRLFPAER